MQIFPHPDRTTHPLLRSLTRQTDLLSAWISACLPATIWLIAVMAAGIALVLYAGLSHHMALALAVLVTSMPVVIILHWLIAVPDIWGIPGRWVAVFVFVATAAFAIAGQYLAAETVNAAFGEAPQLFPVAHAVAGYVGAVLALLLITYALLLFSTLFVPGIVLLIWVVDSRRGWRKLGLVLFLIVATGLTRFAITGIEGLGTKFVIQTALTADFHTNHHCDTRDWPEGVKRIAFIGDEQVLGYRDPGQAFLILGCERTATTADGTAPAR